MATLEEHHADEREKLERLCDGIDRKAHDIPTLVEVLSACQSFSCLDPIPHIKAAMRHYLDRVINVIGDDNGKS